MLLASVGNTDKNIHSVSLPQDTLESISNATKEIRIVRSFYISMHSCFL